MSSLWQQKNGNLSGVKMNGEGTGIGAPTPAMAGYLGKCEDRNASPGNCPWCLAKGQTNALRFYALNLKETVLLCTNPVCLYPLVSRSLEDVRASLSKERCKRSISSLSDVDGASSPPKRLREEKPDMAEFEPCEADNKTQTFIEEQAIPENTVSVHEQPEEEPSVPPEDVDVKEDCVSSSQDEVEEIAEMDVDESSELVPVEPHLFWKNEDNLCWLDSLLVMLVNCRTVRETQNVKLKDQCASVPGSSSAVWRLCSTYDQTCAYLKAREQECEDKVTRVPAGVLSEAKRRLSALRLSVFKLLQPTLKCEIGQRETPVFALPLLLRSDKWAQDIFQHTARWEFKCTSCSYTVNDSVEKTLTTFTQIVNDWHPLKALHRTQCNSCNRKNQRRKLVLEKLSSVFALHFVEGLPRKDLSKYSFEFQGAHYNVSTVIQYNKHLQHFVTWIRQSSGLWLEVDDLKHPHSAIYKRLPFPASEFHVLFWETDSIKDEESEVCSPTASSAVTNVEDTHPNKLSDSVADDSCVISALTIGDSTATSALEASIGSTTLLETFEGLSHKDIVTLTLVESKPTEELQVTQNLGSVPVIHPSPPAASSLSVCETLTSPSSKDKSATAEAVVVRSKKLNTPVFPPSNPPNPQSSGSKAESAASGAVMGRSKLNTPVCQPLNPPKPQSFSLKEGTSASEVVVTMSAKVNAPICQPPNALKSQNSSFTQVPSPFASSLLQRHPSLQSTPVRLPPPAPKPKPILKCDNEALPAKLADMFGGFINKRPNSNGVNPIVAPQQKTTHLPPVKKTSVSPESISTTEALRLKLMKKLKAKKKKLAKLNQLLGSGGESVPKPDSTALSSPYSVTSSTSAYDTPAYDQFFAELLSPATTVSNLSPDSTGLLEMLNNGQNGETQVGNVQQNSSVANVVPEASLTYPSSTNDDVLTFDEYMDSGMGHNPIENTDFNSLDIFF